MLGFEDTDRYFTNLAAAFVRGRLPHLPETLTPAELIHHGQAAELRLHKFKQNIELPRVRKVLGTLQGIGPTSLLDIGSGRGTFLWPLLDTFPCLPVITAERNPLRASDIGAVRRGGVANLFSTRMDATRLGFANRSIDVITILEVLEHLRKPELAAAEAVRVAQRFVIASVPSVADENPEHLRLYDRSGLETLLLTAGAGRVKIEYVLNHMIAIASI